MTGVIDLLNYYIKLEIEGTIDRYIGHGYRNMGYAKIAWTDFDGNIYRKRNPVYFRCSFPRYEWEEVWKEVWFENEFYKNNDSQLMRFDDLRSKQLRELRSANKISCSVITIISYNYHEILDYKQVDRNKYFRSHKYDDILNCKIEYWKGDDDVLFMDYPC